MLELLYKKCTELVPYVNNARTHTDEQVAQIMASMREFGFTAPILLGDQNNILAGHGRLVAAMRLQMKEVPTISLDQLTPAQQKAYILADNKLALNAQWDDVLLVSELEALDGLEFDLTLTGFDLSELNDLSIGAKDEEEKENEVPAIADIIVSKLGDVWTLGRHRLLCADSTDKNNIDLLMDGNKADMVFTDPPYGMHLNTDWSSAKTSLKFASEKGAFGGKNHKAVIGDHDDFTPTLIHTVFDHFSYCKEIFLWGADYYAEFLTDKNKGSWIVWDKRLDESADKMYGSTFELCWSKAKHKRMLARVKWAGIFGTEKEFDKKRHHPTQKPIALVDWFFDYYSVSKKNNVVDLYGGAGSTLISAEKNNMTCFMMELDPAYIDVIVKRWQNYTGETAVNLMDSNAKL